MKVNGQCADISMKYRKIHKWVDGRVLMIRVKEQDDKISGTTEKSSLMRLPL